MSQPLSKQSVGATLAGCTLSVVPAYLHVSLASAEEPFYGPPILSDMIFWVALPCIYLISSSLVILGCVVLAFMARFNWVLMLGVLPLLLGGSMVIESMAEYSGDQYRQFNQNQAHLEKVEAELKRVAASA